MAAAAEAPPLPTGSDQNEVFGQICGLYAQQCDRGVGSQVDHGVGPFLADHAGQIRKAVKAEITTAEIKQIGGGGDPSSTLQNYI